MSDPNLSIPPVASALELLAQFTAQFPDCFNADQPRPLKINIHRELIAAGHDRKAVKRALKHYCRTACYRETLQAGAVRIDLHGQPAGVVTEQEAVKPQTEVTHAPGGEPRREASRPALAPLPPNDTPLPKESLVPGRLELTVKFSELPTPLQVQGGMKVGIQTGEGIVTAILPPKIWRKLEQSAQTYPQWVAALSGALNQHDGENIALKHPALQIFEKKAKATSDAKPPTEKAPNVSPAAPPSSEAETPKGAAAHPSPAHRRATISLKNKGRQVNDDS